MVVVHLWVRFAHLRDSNVQLKQLLQAVFSRCKKQSLWVRFMTFRRSLRLFTRRLRYIMPNVLLVLVSIILFLGACEMMLHLTSYEIQGKGQSDAWWAYNILSGTFGYTLTYTPEQIAFAEQFKTNNYTELRDKLRNLSSDELWLLHENSTGFPGLVGHHILGWTVASTNESREWIGDLVSVTNQSARGSEYYGKKLPDETRIMLLGDSFIFGSCLNDTETIPSLINGSSTAIEAINYGIPGYGHDQMLLRYVLEGYRLEPDVVVVGLTYFDEYRNVLKIRDYPKPYFLFDDGDVRINNVPTPSIDAFWWTHWKVAMITKKTFDEMIFASNDDKRSKITISIMHLLEAEVKQDGARMVYLYLPNQEEVTYGKLKSDTFSQLCENTDVFCIQPLEEIQHFLENASTSEIADHFSCHYSPEIAEIIAASASDALIDAMHAN